MLPESERPLAQSPSPTSIALSSVQSLLLIHDFSRILYLFLHFSCKVFTIVFFSGVTARDFNPNLATEQTRVIIFFFFFLSFVPSLLPLFAQCSHETEMRCSVIFTVWDD